MTLSAADILKKRWPPQPSIRILRTAIPWARDVYSITYYDAKGGRKHLAIFESRQKAIEFAARVAFAHGVAVRGLGGKDFVARKREAAAKRAKRVTKRARKKAPQRS